MLNIENGEGNEPSNGSYAETQMVKIIQIIKNNSMRSQPSIHIY